MLTRVKFYIVSSITNLIGADLPNTLLLSALFQALSGDQDSINHAKRQVEQDQQHLNYRDFVQGVIWLVIGRVGGATGGDFH